MYDELNQTTYTRILITPVRHRLNLCTLRDHVIFNATEAKRGHEEEAPTPDLNPQNEGAKNIQVPPNWTTKLRPSERVGDRRSNCKTSSFGMLQYVK